MGQYKVPQNVEAEDHILGPLTFKQFIYAMIGSGWAIICFALFRMIPIVMIVMGLPPTILFLLLAFFRKDGQDFEHLLVAMVGFFSATHYRLWVKERTAESFHITPTAKAAEISQRNPAQVISELEKLATLIDSRGWNIPIGPDNGAHSTLPSIQHAQRIVAPAAPPPSQLLQQPHTDMLDLQNSPLAQNLSVMLQQSADKLREQAVSQMTATQMAAPATVAPFTTATTAADSIIGAPSQYALPQIPLLQSAQAQPAQSQPAQAQASSISGVTAMPPNDILRLATQSEGMSVASVAAQATRMNPIAAPAATPLLPNPIMPSGPMMEQNNG